MTAPVQDLDEFLAGPEPDYDQPPEAPQDADRADEQLRRLAKVRAEIDQVEAHARAKIDQIDAWRRQRLHGDDDHTYGGLMGRERWLAEGLEMWHRAVLADDPSRKTISLPCGTLKSRVQQPEWVFDDEVFIAWAAKHAPGLVRIPEPKPQVDKAAVKKTLGFLAKEGSSNGIAVTDEGEVAPGVTVTVRPPSFTVVTEEVGE